MMNVGWFFAGGALSLFNVLTLWWTVQQLRPEAMVQAISLAIGGMFARLLLATGLFSVIIQHGLLATVSTLAGFLAVRSAIVYWLGR